MQHGRFFPTASFSCLHFLVSRAASGLGWIWNEHTVDPIESRPNPSLIHFHLDKI